jgi:hypothetical protein
LVILFSFLFSIESTECSIQANLLLFPLLC